MSKYWSFPEISSDGTWTFACCWLQHGPYDITNRTTGFWHDARDTSMPALQLLNAPASTDEIIDPQGLVLYIHNQLTTYWLPPFQTSFLRPVGNLPQLFFKLRENNYKIGICTSDTRANTMATLAALHMDHLVDAVRDDVWTRPKPHPSCIQYLCGYVQTIPEHVIIVGDAPTDMLAGKAAGCSWCIGVTTTGTGTKESLGGYTDVMIDSITDLPSLLGLV